MSSEGKEFEHDIANSCKNQNIWKLKIRDTYTLDRKAGVNTNINPFDFLLHHNGVLWAIECKSFLGKSIGFQLTPDEPKASIKAHQIKGLLDSSQYENNRSGFLLNFRDVEKTYFLDISDFLRFVSDTKKKSINEQDIINYGGVLLDQKKLRTHYLYDIKALLEMPLKK